MGTEAQEVVFTAKIDNVNFEPTSLKKRRTNKEIDAEIKLLKQEQESNVMHEQNLDTAKRIYDLYASYIEAGFDEEQAWKLVITMIQNLKN